MGEGVRVMLPKSIDAFIGPCPVMALEDSRKYRGTFCGDTLTIRIDLSHPPSWQAQTLIHEMAHLACNLTRGMSGDPDEREEDFATAMGRFMTKVLIDNPGLLDLATDLHEVDVIGEVWKIERVSGPGERTDDLASWLHTRSSTMRVGEGQSPEVQRLRIFQMTCEAVLQAAGIEDFSNDYYWANGAMLYSLLRANPGAHPLAVIADGPSE